MSDFDLVISNKNRKIGSKVLDSNGKELNFSKLVSISENSMKYMIIYKMCGKVKINSVEINKDSTVVVKLSESEVLAYLGS